MYKANHDGPWYNYYIPIKITVLVCTVFSSSGIPVNYTGHCVKRGMGKSTKCFMYCLMCVCV